MNQSENRFYREKPQLTAQRAFQELPLRTAPSEWTFRTRRYEARYWRTEFLAVAEIHHLPNQLWPIAAAVDLGCKKSRQALVCQAIGKATDRIITNALER